MQKKIYRQETDRWYVERIVFLIAGIFVVLSEVMSLAGHPNFRYFTLLVGAMLINFSLTGYCPLAVIVAKFGVRGK
ncbi:MAG: DUF2892 domain-containing protein [Parcubacteria group bacterium]|jgi:hypothetical protein